MPKQRKVAVSWEQCTTESGELVVVEGTDVSNVATLLHLLSSQFGVEPDTVRNITIERLGALEEGTSAKALKQDATIEPRALREPRVFGGVQSLKAGLTVVLSWVAVATSFARKR
ncbi:hypothetical protein ONR57_11770 [Hoyosella sp. YIM 151337]|uniref:hypothetical protein n=1 Tax=Hoyosella sp. YIM 151337 TaxID=2992742 RepID=UPI002236B331|nr:hypothetical protein [Hoyosella sp. YIM 151337]MCW4353977.1 hypothetical protein [Hoyosella sp. YIM 151337]